VPQSRRTTLAERPSGQTSQEAFAGATGGLAHVNLGQSPPPADPGVAKSSRPQAHRARPKTMPPKKSWRPVLPSETALGYLCLLHQLRRRRGVPLAFFGDQWEGHRFRSPASSRLQLRHGDIIHVAVKGTEPCCYNTLS